MNQPNKVHLWLKPKSTRPFPKLHLHTATVQHLCLDTELVPADTEVSSASGRIPIGHDLDLQLQDKLRKLALDAFKQGDVARLFRLSNKAIAFGQDDLKRDTVSLAYFFQGVGYDVIGQQGSAFHSLLNACRGPMGEFAVCHSNLAAVSAALGDTETALEEVDKAIAIDPGCVAAFLNRHHLVEFLMADEKGRPAAADLQALHEANLAFLSQGEMVMEFCQRDSFPPLELYSIFPKEPQAPLPLFGLTPRDTGGAAARELLHHAKKAMYKRRYARAALLAGRAGTMSPLLATAAAKLEKRARQHLQEQQKYDRARVLAQTMTDWDWALQHLDITNPDRAQVDLALLLPLLSAEELEEVTRLHQDGVEALLSREHHKAKKLRRRAQLNTLRANLAEQHRAAFANAAKLGYAMDHCRSFWAALAQGRWPIAEAALDRVEKFLGREHDLVQTGRAILRELQRVTA